MSIATQPVKVRNEETMDGLLRDLQPIIHYTSLLIRLIQWKDKKQSLLLFLSLIIWRKLNTCILCLLPLFGLVLIKFYKDFTITSTDNLPPPPQQQQQKQKDLIKDLTEIRNMLYLITPIKHWIQESDTLCRAYYQYYSISTAKTRSIILFGVTSVVAIIYAGWIILLYQQIIIDASSLLRFMILIIMSLASPWTNPIYTASVRAISPLIYSFHVTTTKHVKKVEEKDDVPKQEYMNLYCFEIYHHQRRWGPTGWCNNLLLRSDVPPWTDIHLEPTPSIHQFQLPPTTFLGKPNERNQRKVISWVWADPAWTIRKDGTDKSGWQYGNWKWRSWSSQSGGIMNCTRRQKWSRYAQRKESWVDVKIESCCSSIIGGSATDGDSSVYNWDSPISTSSSSSIY